MTLKKQKLTLLIVDDEEIFARNFSRWLSEDLGYEVEVVDSAAAALNALNKRAYDGIVVDYYLQGDDGLRLLSDLKEKKEHNNIPVIFITGYDRAKGREALRQGAFWYLEKPIDFTEAAVIFEYLAERKRLLDLTLAKQKKRHKKPKEQKKQEKQEEQEEQEARASAALAALSHALLSAEDESALLQTVAEKAPAFLEAQAVQITLLDPATGNPKDAAEQKDNGARLVSASSEEQNILVGEALIKALEALREQIVSLEEPPSVQRALEWQDEKGNLRAMLCVAPRPRPPERQASAQKGEGEKAEQVREERQRGAHFPHPLALVVARYDEMPSPEIASRLVVVARLAGAALAHHRQRRLFQALGEAATEILAAPSAKALYQTVGRVLEGVFEASTYYLALYKPREKRITFPVFVEGRRREESPILPAPPDPESGLTGYILHTGEPWECVKARPDAPCPPLGNFRVHRRGKPSWAILALPLKVGGRVIGVHSIQRHAPVPFLSATREALQTLGALTALAWDRLEREEQHTAFLERIFREPLQETLMVLARRAKEALRADIVTLHVYDAQHEIFRPERARLGLREDEAKVPRKCQVANDALQRLLASKAREHFAEDATEDEIFQGSFVEKYGVRSSGGVVLQAEGERGEAPVGVLIVNYNERHTFTEEEKAELRRLGQDAALAIKVALLAERERQARERLQLQERALQKIEQVRERAHKREGGVTPQEWREDLAAEVVTILKEAWPKVGCVEVTPSILFADYGERVLRFPQKIRRWYSIDKPEERDREHIGFDEGICGWVARHRQPYYAPDVGEDKVYLNLIEATRSEIAVPILLGDRLLGVLDIEANVPRFFTPEDQEFLERLAKALGTTLGAFGKQEDAKRVQEIARQAAEHPQRASEILLEGAFKLVDRPEGSITAVTLFLRDEDALVKGPSYSPTKPSPKCLGCPERFPLGAVVSPRGIVVRAALEGRTQVVRDVSQDPDYVRCHKQTVAEMAVPFFGEEGEVVGVLNVEYKDAQAIDYQDQELLESLAAQTPILMALEAQSGELEKEARRRRLSGALAALGIAAADYGHQWKNELAAFRGTVGMLNDQLKGICEPGKPSWQVHLARRLGLLPDLAAICRWLQRVRRILEGPLRTDFPAPDEKVETIEVGEWLREVQQRWHRRLEDRTPEASVEVVLESLPASRVAVKANRRWLTRAVDNLVSNARRAALKVARERGRMPRVALAAKKEGDGVVISVRDNGLGIPSEVRPYLFRGRVPKELARGHGTGMLITAFVAQFYDGEVRVARTGEEGTEIVLEMPVAPSSDGEREGK